MMDVNLVSQWGPLVLGGPLLFLAVICFVSCATSCGMRVLMHKAVWDGAAKPFMFLGIMLTLVGGIIAGPSLPALFSLLF